MISNNNSELASIYNSNNGDILYKMLKSNQLEEGTVFNILKSTLKNGKYAQVRRLSNYHNDLVSKFPLIFSLLERQENNLNASIDICNKCLQKAELQKRALIILAQIYIQTAEYDIAELMLKTLSCYSNFKFQSNMHLATIYLLENDPEKAYNILKQSLDSKMTKDERANHNNFLNNINVILGKTKKSTQPCDEKLVIEHITKHSYSPITNSPCFLKGADLEELFNISKEKILQINCQHFMASDFYKFRTDEPVECINGLDVYGICVVTLINTKRILTIYPISISSEFDKENFNNNEQIKNRRNSWR